MSSHDVQRLQRKQQALAALATGLSQKLTELGIEAGVRRALLDYPQSSADQLRLQLRGGWSWETVRAEWRIYTSTHPEASAAHRVFKLLTLLAALVVPPRVFYKTRRILAGSKAYNRMRERVLPVPQMEHIEKCERRPVRR